MSNSLPVLHCVSSYPAPMDQMNLSVISNLRNSFGCPVGFSDHTVGAEVACAAVAMGARIFEKHLTLDRSMSGPDHQAALDPDEMLHYCKSLREVLTSIGDGVKRIMPCEENTRKAFRRFLVAARDLTEGTVLRYEDCTFKKVVDGISPRYIELVIGSHLTEDVKEDAVLSWSMLRKS